MNIIKSGTRVWILKMGKQLGDVGTGIVSGASVGACNEVDYHVDMGNTYMSFGSEYVYSDFDKFDAALNSAVSTLKLIETSS